ncbi:MAG: hypothetical protein UMU75_08285 [Halomonas sp.]|nr:hypothetical protein [Halomonas sp.]
MRVTHTPLNHQPRLAHALPQLLAATSLLLLSGCTTTAKDSGLSLGDATVDPAYRDWFDGGTPADMDSMDWGRVEFARQAIEAGNTRRAIAMLNAMIQQGFPPAYYEMGKLYEQGQGVERDLAKAAHYYDEALRVPSPILGNASLHLGRLYRDGQGVERNDRLAYLLFRQAVAEQAGPSAKVALADMLAQGRGTQAAPDKAAALYSQAAAMGNTQALRELATGYSRGGRLERDSALARKYAQRYANKLKQRARQGDVDAMAGLAGLYDDDGLLGPQPQAHRRWLLAAARAGHVGSMGQAGEALLSEGRTSQALAMLRQAARAGDRYAMADLGEALLDSDLSQARHWLARAAEGGSVSAAAALGRSYLNTDGAAADPQQAARWLARAADAGHAGAAADLGRLYLAGKGVDRNVAKGIAYLEKAAARGHTGARADLGERLLTGRDVPADPTRAIHLLTEAAQAGNLGAARQLGTAYLKGTGIAADTRQAEKWLTRASEAGDMTARFQLGYAYLQGTAGFDRDPAHARQLLASAAEAGHAGAQVALGRALLRGEQLPQDRKRGVELLYHAARQGHPTARLALAKAYLWANGLESANQQQALLWLDTVLDGDSHVALETMRQLLTEANDETVAKAML